MVQIGPPGHDQSRDSVAADALMFDLAPFFIVLSDFSAVKALFDAWRAEGMTSLSDHLRNAPGRTRECIALIRLIKINRHALAQLAAVDSHQIIGKVESIIGPASYSGFSDQFVQLWDAGQAFSARLALHRLAGGPIELAVKSVVLPGSEHTWDRLMITAESAAPRKTIRSQIKISEDYARELFDHSPVSIWLEDGSELKSLFESWRAQGVTSLRDYLLDNPERFAQCAASIRIVEVNRKTLQMFEATDLQHIIDNLATIFGEHALIDMMDTLEQFWEGNYEYSANTVNYTLTGKRLDVQIWSRVLPGAETTWSQVLLVIEDVTERETARRQADLSEAYARRLFEHSPVALSVEDYTEVKLMFDALRTAGVTDLAAYIDRHPEFIGRCIDKIRIIDVNHRTLNLFKAADKAALLQNFTTVLGSEARDYFCRSLVDLWQGRLFQQREVIHYAVDGTPLNLHLQFSVFSAHEDDWSLIQVAVMDITARKKAEAELEYLSKHDVTTQLYNRSFYGEALSRFDREGTFPVTILVVDLNGLKTVNDRLGHAAGDDLLRRTGEVLTTALAGSGHAARIGGDEFVLLLPGSDEKAGIALARRIQEQVAMNNRLHPDSTLSLATGAATGLPGERMKSVVNRADRLMYEAKRAFYADTPREPHLRRAEPV